jgi:hypothetical protein
MVQQDSSGPDFLSGDEIRELLRDGPLPDADPAADVSRGAECHPGDRSVPLRVLLISRGDRDAALVRSRLEATGMRVNAVRNPFMALDQLRALPHDAVVSDFDLWADDAALLFERLRQADKDLPVVFLGNPREDRNKLETRARRAGAWGVIPRPFHAGEVETTARNLLEAARGACAGDEGTAGGDWVTGGDGEGEGFFSPLPPAGDAVPPRSSQADGIPPLPQGDGTRGELPWLRFYFQLSRTVQSSTSGRVPPRELLAVARQALSPAAIGVFYAEGGRASACLETASDEASPGVSSTAFDRLLQLCARRSGVSSDGSGSLTLHVGPLESSARGTLTLAGLSTPACEAANAFLPEIQRLLQSGLG